MYENNNTVSIDWKGLFIKIVIVALIVFAIFKGYEYFSNNKKINVSTSSNASQLFNANLESLKQAGENYFDYSNYPSEGQTVMVTLGELLTKGDINELYDDKGNVCSRENSYVAVTNDGGQYKLKATLSCGDTSNYTVDTIGCECEEENICSESKKEEKETTSSEKQNTSTEKETTKKNKESKKTTKKVTTKAEQLNDERETTKKITTTKKTTIKTTTTKITTKKNVKTYTVKFDSNGGDYIEPQYVERYDTAYEPNEPEKDDARFVGWYYKGKLFDFDTEITKNITLEAYYWETKDDVKTTVYSAAWDTYGTSYVTVTHKLAIPTELQDNNIKNVRIKKITSKRTMSPYSNDLYYHRLYHSKTYDGYNYSNGVNSTTDSSTLARLYNINVRKTYSYTYDRWITWSAYVGNQCAYTFDGTNCNYGIVYDVVWEYDEFTD